MKLPVKFLRLMTASLVFFSLTNAFAYDTQIVPSTCRNYVGVAGQVSHCPTNQVLWKISDQVEPYGKFESFSCCRVRDRSGSYMRIDSWSAHTVGTQYSQAALCPRGEVLIGVGFDNAGGAGTMRCARFETPGRYVSTYNVQESILYTNGSAECQRSQVAIGLGDHISPDGTIDALMCAYVDIR